MAGRAVGLARCLSAGESLHVRTPPTITSACASASASILTHHIHADIADGKRYLRFRSASNPAALEVARSSFLKNRNSLIKTMSSASSSDESAGAVHSHQFTNRLVDELSPYLLQHAHNPVDWYPWGEDAFKKAKQENKLIFLSVGYSTCHWCHVMEHESFENETIAKIMNNYYVNIKVDREERPDIDRVYMTFIHATSDRGGWPMSVFLTPELQPVTGGTYYPPEDKWGRPGFKTILLNLAHQWNEQKDEFMSTGAHIIDVLKKVSEIKKSTDVVELPGEECWKKCVSWYTREFDDNFGGFGSAPKFPQASIFNFLFHAYSRDKDSSSGKKCLNMCLHTLKKIAQGGIHDHVSNGFARYSVDGKWHVPHFEKMLYDQAQLVIAYTDAYLATKDEFYSDVIKDILTYVDRDLSHESGGFYSAEDADSFPTKGAPNKLEGAFCVWEYDEIESLLGDKFTPDKLSYMDIFCHHFNVKQDGNVEPGHGSELDNKNILIIYGSAEETAEKFKITTEKLSEILEECRQVLYDRRSKRPRPHLDSKMLCSWNGLMIAGFSRAGQTLGDKKYIDRAIKAATFVKKYLYNENEKILYRSCYRDSHGDIAQISTPIKGFLDDYAFLIKGLLDLYEASLNRDWLEWACQLQEKQDELFWDEKGHGYFTSQSRDVSVVLRLKEDQDGAEPSGNSVAVHNLVRLGAHDIGGGTPRRERAEKVLTAFASRLEVAPSSLPEMLSALMFHKDSPTQVFIAGGRDDPRTQALLRVVRTRLLPGRIVAVADPGACGNTVFSRIRPLGDAPAAYVCRHYACSLPVTEASKLEEILDEKP
ncbi:spermatogenesis-associated protein 20 isoform X2 [Arctopsyche grandis]|uniref:spermatogenesis-associated protein 20 isoform X2 n=1 Tax=Arctopsyche grandis TaxID=121162 RepID=UPI00406D6E15